MLWGGAGGASPCPPIDRTLYIDVYKYYCVQLREQIYRTIQVYNNNIMMHLGRDIIIVLLIVPLT